MICEVQSGTLFIDGQSVPLEWPVLQALEHSGKVFALLDPDAYTGDPNQREARRAGAPAIRNLLAFDRHGNQLWRADMPDSVDYYYRIASVVPLVAYSFSCYRCEIDSENGRIKVSEFVK